MTTEKWLSPTSGIWSDGSNWSHGKEPGPGDTAKIPAVSESSPYTITVTDHDEIKALDLMDPNATLLLAEASSLLLDTGGRNKGTIDATSDSQLGVDGTLINSGGTMNADAGYILLGPGESHFGTISGGTIGIYDGGIVGTFETEGTIEDAKIIDHGGTGGLGTADGALTLTNDKIDARDAGNLIVSDGPSAVVNLDGTTVLGGTFEDFGTGGVFQTTFDTTSTLVGSTIDSRTPIGVVAGSTLALKGTITNEGAIAVGLFLPPLLSLGNTTAIGATIDIEGTVKLEGGGKVELTDLSGNQITAPAPPPESVGSSVTVGTLDNIDNTIAGAGDISVDVENGAAGTIDATGGNALVLSGAVTNLGTLEAQGSGGLLVTGSVTNKGLVYADGGNVTIDGALTGGNAEISGGATLMAGSDAKLAVDFVDGTGVFALQSSVGFKGPVSNLGATDAIDLQDLAFADLTTEKFHQAAPSSGALSSGTLTLGTASQTDKITLLGTYMNNFAPTASSPGFILSPDAGGGTLVSYGTLTLPPTAAHGSA